MDTFVHWFFDGFLIETRWSIESSLLVKDTCEVFGFGKSAIERNKERLSLVRTDCS